ncbi:hypothetical protein Ancab_004888 [Ancistrocladus abbreviatus]
MKLGVKAPHRSTNDGYNRYLKPGALAQLRDSKIFKKPQIYLHNLLPTTSVDPSPSNGGDASSVTEPANPIPLLSMEVVPCFSVRTYRPRCLRRKKLAASMPIFTQSQS